MKSWKEVGRVLFDTWYGAWVVCGVFAAAATVGVLLCWCPAGEAMFLVFGGLLVVSLGLPVAAFFRSLWKRAWGRAAAHVGMYFVGAGLLVAVMMGASAGAEAIADRLKERQPWMAADEKNGVVPFEVEYRYSQPYPSLFGGVVQLDRRVVFDSGACAEVPGGGVSHADFSVYVLDDGAYAMGDRWGHVFRVDADAGTVEPWPDANSETLRERGTWVGTFWCGGPFSTDPSDEFWVGRPAVEREP